MSVIYAGGPLDGIGIAGRGWMEMDNEHCHIPFHLLWILVRGFRIVMGRHRHRGD